MRAFVAVAITVALVANAPEISALETINLDVPGNLKAIERTHPDHFVKIQRILADVPRRPLGDDSVATWMRTEFQARDIRYTDLIMTSFPPKKRLEFALDNTSYVKVITLQSNAKALPVKKAPAK